MAPYIRKIAIVLILMLVGKAAFSQSFVRIDSIDADTEFPLIKLYSTVQNKNYQPLTGLSEENLFIYEDGYRINYIQIRSSEESQDTIYLVFSLDSSKSISEKEFVRLKKASTDIISGAGSKERIALFRFNDEVIMLSSFSDNKTELINKINSITRHGSKTLLYNAIYDSIDLLERAEGGRRSVIIFTDGKDEGSAISTDDIVKFSREKGIPVHFFSFKNAENYKLLERISLLTGGHIYKIESVENLSASYTELIRAIKQQYIIKYTSQLKKDGKTHNVELRLKYNEIRDRHTKEFTLGKQEESIKIPGFTEILLIILIFLVLIIIVLFIILMAKRKYAQIVNGDYSVEKKKNFIEKKTPVLTHVKYEENPVEENNKPKKISPFFDGHPLPESEDINNGSGKAWLILKDGSTYGKKFAVSWKELSIGKSQDCGIVLNDPAVSDRHCFIRQVDSNYFLFDAASDSGTYLNDTKLLRPKKLYDWDEIQIGRTMFIFRTSSVK